MVKHSRFMTAEQIYNSFACSSFVYHCSFFLQQCRIMIILICKPDTSCVEESHIVQMDLYSGYTGRSFRLPGTTPYKVRSGLIRAINGESRWPFLAVFHRFRIVIRHSRSVYTVSSEQKRPSFHAVSVEEV